MDKLRVGIVYGGRSVEHEVSIASATSIREALDPSRYELTLIAIAQDRAKWFDRSPAEFEFQMLYGIRPDEQARLARAGHTVRVYVPYGTEWYGYLMRRLAERPANLTFFARALVSKK